MAGDEPSDEPDQPRILFCQFRHEPFFGGPDGEAGDWRHNKIDWRHAHIADTGFANRTQFKVHRISDAPPECLAARRSVQPCDMKRRGSLDRMADEIRLP